MKCLVMAEKPSVAREIARVLKCNKKNNGYIEGDNYVVTWALGHLVTLAEPDDYDKKYKEWKMEDLPMLPEGNMKLKVLRQTSKQFSVVRGLMQRADLNELIIATDAGREGELVARWIMILGGWKKPFKRLWISSQTDSAIIEGFRNLKPGHDYDNLFSAAQCRAEADWLIGLNVSRALTCKYNAQLNAGRVQTPTLSIMIDRENEIKNFKPVPYYTIEADFDEYTGIFRDKSGQTRIFESQKAQDILNSIQKRQGKIIDIKKEEKQEMPPLAYDLTELQRDGNKKFGFSAKKTLTVLQGLYEIHKIVTYPRTDSRYIPEDVVPTLKARLMGMNVGEYSDMVKSIISKPIKTTKRFVDSSKVSDHHALLPTEEPLNLSKLSSDEKKIYDLIAKRFISVLGTPFKYKQITLITEINGFNFYSSCRVIEDLGWKKYNNISEKIDNNDDIPTQTITEQNKGSIKTVKSCRIITGKTKAPARYNEATLLTAMESPGKFMEDEELRESIKQGGLGTPATRAEIIEKLISSNYIERNGRELVPTTTGMQLINLVPQNLTKPELTAEWELRLSEISKGRGQRSSFMNDIRENAVNLVDDIKSDSKTYNAGNLTKQKCPMCGKYMLLIKGKRGGNMLVCQDRKCGFRKNEKEDEGFKTSARSSVMNQKLISKYADTGNISTNIGELLKQAMNQKK